jgi:hypothetical protein
MIPPTTQEQETTMKSLLVLLLACIGLVCTTPKASSQNCYHGDGSIYVYYPWSTGYSFSPGNSFLEYFEVYTYTDAHFEADITTNNQSTWTLLDNDINYYDYYWYYGYGYGYEYVPIPSNIGFGTQCFVRVREVPNNSKDCAYNYDGYSYQFTIVRPCVTPKITTQPTNLTACQGSNYSLTAVTSVDPGYISWEWYRNNTLISTSTTTSTLALNNIQTSSAGSYYLKVKDACGTSINSNTVTVVVNLPTAITVQPVNTTICEGAAGSLSVTGTGTNITYQWFKNGVAMAGETKSTYNIASATADDATSYYVTVTGACPPVVTSNVVDITVPPKPKFVTPLKGGYFCPGTTGSITANVTGSPLAYQWYKGDVPIPGANASTLTLPNISTKDNGNYWVYVKVPGATGGCPTDATSNRVFVGVYEAPVILEQPKSVDLCAGADARLFVKADGSDLSYQWFRNGAAIANSNNYQLNLNDITTTQGGSFTCKVNSICGFSATTTAANVNVFTEATIDQQPKDVTVKVGELISLSVQATGAQTITWLHNEKQILSGVSNTLTIPNAQLSNAGFYRALVSNVCGGVSSTLARVTVIDPASLIPTLTVSPAMLDAGNVPFGYSKDVTFNALLTNSGNVPVNVTGMSFSGPNSGDFAVNNAGTPFSLAKGETRNVTVTFTPSTVGMSQALLNVASNATAGNNSSAIYGNGVVLYSTDQTLSFGTVDLREKRIKCFTINNSSSTNITIDRITVSGANMSEFVVSTPLPTTINAGSTKEICIEFTPQAVGQRTATFAIWSSTGGNSSVNGSGTCEIASGLTDDALAAGMSIFPNPTSGSVTISTGDLVAQSVSVFDANGALIVVLHPDAKEFSWNCINAAGAPISSGSYNVVVTNELGSYHMKLQVSR